MSNYIMQQVNEHKPLAEEAPVASQTPEAPDEERGADDLLAAALRAVEEARAGSRAASNQSVLVNAIVW